MLKEKNVLINLNEFELSLKGKQKEKVGIQNSNYENIVKTIKIYEYDLKPKKDDIEENENVQLKQENEQDNEKLNVRLI